MMLLQFGAPGARAASPELAFRVAPTELTRGLLGSFEVVASLPDGVEASGPLALGLELPPGVSVAEAGARVMPSSGGAMVGVFGRSPGGTIQLRASQGGVARGVTLGPGEVVRFRFSLKAGPASGRAASDGVTAASDGRVAVVSARLEDLEGVPRSDVVSARVGVRPDAELDLGLALGTVFCDADGDGLRDAGEMGLGGVRIVSDTGRAVDTDADGRWHLRDLKPGAHVLKLDVNTLPPPSVPIGSPRALVDVTPGLTVHAAFAVTCALETVRPEVLVPPPRPIPGRIAAPTALGAVLAGNAEALTVEVGGLALAPARLVVDVAPASHKGRSPAPPADRPLNLPWSPSAPEPSVLLALRVAAGEAWLPPDDGVARWEVAIHRQARRDTPEGPPIRVFVGAGALPERLVWDGRDAQGTYVFGRGSRVLVRAEIARQLPVSASLAPASMRVTRERLVAAPRVLGHGWRGRAAGETEVARYRLDAPRFEASGALSRALSGSLEVLAERVRAFATSDLLVELVVDGGSEAGALPWVRELTARLGLLYGLPPGRLHVRATVVGRPRLGPASPRELRLSWQAPEPPEALPPLDLPRAEPQALLGGDPLALGTGAAFAGVVAPAATAGLTLIASDGASRSLLLTASEALASEDSAPDLAALAALDPLAGLGGSALVEALGPSAVSVSLPARVTASEFEIVLPPRDSVMSAPRLFVSGRTHPENTIIVGHERMTVRKDGGFAGLVPLPAGLKALVIESHDRGGHVARITWPLAVSPTEHFLLALGDVSGGLDAHLTELPHYDTWRNDGLFLAGRAALLARGRIAGAVLGRELRYAVHADTARRDRFEPYFQQMIDPTRDYVVFGDGTDDTLVSPTRGPLYVLVEVDRSSVGYGAFHTDMRGVHLFRYERTFDGAHADLRAASEGERGTRLRAFATTDNRGLVRRHDELRATGGSLYYLSHKALARGSERVELVIRELGTGMELGRARLARDRDYRIDYALGRLVTEGPVPSVVDALFTIGAFQPFAGRAIQQGHEVWSVVGYEADAPRAGGDMAWGAQLVQPLGDWLEVGAGVAREGRPGGAASLGGDYLVWGSHAKVRAGAGSWAAVEVAGTTAQEGVARRSTDGGLAYGPIARTAAATRGGWGLFAAAEADVGELAGESPDALDLKLRGHWQLLQPGFRVAGLANEEGSEKWGGEAVWRPVAAGRAIVRYDGGRFLLSQPGVAAEPAVRQLERHRLLGRYEHTLAAPLTLFGEVAAGDQGDQVISDLPARSPLLAAVAGDSPSASAPGVAAFSVGARWRIWPSLALLAAQEALAGGDARTVGRGGAARVRTEAGAELALTSTTRLRALGSLRWNGDHAARLGVITPVEGGGHAYLEERVERGVDNARLVRASVVGLETDLGGARAFGEYRLDGGVGGRTNRAVLGLSRAVDLGAGVRALLAWERSAALASGTTGRGARDVFSGGLQVLGWDRLKLQGLFEARWDRDRLGEAAAEVLQALSRVNADLRLADGLTLLGLLDHALTQDLATRAVLVEDLLATVGLAWRPVGDDDVMFTLRWTRTAHRTEGPTTAEGDTWTPGAPESLGLTGPSTITTGDLISVGGRFELPWRLQLTEKLVWRQSRTRTSDELDQGAMSSDAAMWLTRLAFHVVAGVDLAAELRLIATLATGQLTQTGGLLEAAWRLAEHARLGVGWNVGADDARFQPDALRTGLRNGIYFRMSGLY